MLVINSHYPKQSAQPQTLFTEDAELRVLVFAGVVVGGFVLMVKFNQECAKIA